LVSIPFEPHLRFGQCVSRRYQVFKSVRHEKVFSLLNAFDLVENRRVYLYAFPRALFQDFPQARAQLHFQAAQMQQIRSPLLLNILSSGEEEDLFYFVEEHPKGESLAGIFRERKRRHQPFSDREALGLCWLLCRTLEGIHQFTVHGFLHPLDIYLEPWPEGPISFYPKVAHTGIRTMLRAVRMPLEGLRDEAAWYASPEFIAYRPLQKQVDVYGVVAILYALLTLRSPTGRFVRPSSVRPGLSGTVDQILLRALDEDPDDRYPTPDALAKALETLWVLGTHRQELERAVGRLPGGDALAGATEIGPATRGMPGSTLPKGDESAKGSRAAEGVFSLFFSDKVRAFGLVLLMLINLGLFCQVAMEAGSSGGRDRPDPREYGRWESMFSDLDGSWES
jgi:hypothetical protein